MVKYCMSYKRWAHSALAPVCPLRKIRVDAGTLALFCQAAFCVGELKLSQDARGGGVPKKGFSTTFLWASRQASGLIFCFQFVCSIVLKTFCGAKCVAVSVYCERAGVVLFT